MSSQFSNAKRNSGKANNVTSIITSQRSTCNVVIYRWNNPNIVKATNLNAASEAQSFLKGTNPTNGNLKEDNRVVIKNDVVKCAISKAKNNSAGQFSITLKRGKEVKNGTISSTDINYLDLVNSGDWVMIYMKKSGTINVDSTSFDSGLKCVGIIENVRYVEIDDEETGKPRLEYIITGQDFGKIFDMDIFFNPLINKEQASAILGAKFLKESLDSIKGSERPNAFISPDEAVKKLSSFYLGGNQGLDALNTTNEAWYVPKSLALNFKPDFKNRSAVAAIDLLDMNRIGLHKYSANKFRGVDKLPGGTFFKSLPSEGTVWSVLQFAQNAIVNEMFTDLVRDPDTGNLKPALVMRQVPYSNRKGHETSVFDKTQETTSDVVSASLKTHIADLPRLTINSSDIKQKNVGKSDFERVNHLLVVPKIDDVANLDFAYVSAANVPSIQRYGLSSFKGQSSYIFDSAIGNPQKLCQHYLSLMMDWFFLAHQYYNGTIVIDGPNENVELGSNLFIEDISQLFHIEGYSHDFINSAGGATSYVTSLTVSRGQQLRGSQTRFIGPESTREPTTITTSVLEGIR